MKTTIFRLVVCFILNFTLVPHVNSAEPVNVKASTVREWLQGQQIIHEKQDWSWQSFQIQYGQSDSYPVQALKRYQPPPTIFPKTGFQTHLLLRRSFNDVVGSEDPTVASPEKKKTSLKGALFSYANDGKASSDTWSAQAALLIPFIWERGAYPDLMADYFAIIPSITINKINTNGDVTKEVDQLTYRLGLMSTWLYGKNAGGGGEIEIRGYGTLATNTDHDSKIFAGELELEPRLWVKDSFFAMGYSKALLTKQPEEIDAGDNITLAYLLRIYARGVLGHNNDAETIHSILSQDFFHAGFVVSLGLDPFFTSKLAVTAKFQYLPDISGRSERETLLELTGAWKIFEDQSTGRRFSLEASYTKGGLDVTTQDVDALLIGVGVVY